MAQIIRRGRQAEPHVACILTGRNDKIVRIGTFLAEIENLFSSRKDANDGAIEANDTTKEANEKALKQSWLSAMILDFHL